MFCTLTNEQINIIISFFEVASKDPTRIHLNGVNLDAGDGKLVISAADGYMSIQHTSSISEGVDFNIIISRDSLPILKLLKKDKKVDLKYFIEDDYSVKINEIPLKIFNREFPNINNVYPTEFKEIREVNIDPDLITRAKKACFNTKNHAFTFKFTDPLAPITIQCKEYRILIMPRK